MRYWLSLNMNPNGHQPRTFRTNRLPNGGTFALRIPPIALTGSTYVRQTQAPTTAPPAQMLPLYRENWARVSLLVLAKTLAKLRLRVLHVSHCENRVRGSLPDLAKTVTKLRSYVLHVSHRENRVRASLPDLAKTVAQFNGLLPLGVPVARNCVC